MGSRRKARELAVQVLFHLEFSRGDPSAVFDLICENFGAPEPIRSFSKTLVTGVCAHQKELDFLIRKASTNWRLERMPRVERCTLRLAIFEMLFMKDIPPKVSIDEAVEIGKKFGTEDSGSFVNGVLDNIFNRLLEEGRLKELVP